MACLKQCTATLIFVALLSLIQTVYSEDVLNEKCDYYCNISGEKYNGHTIMKNTEGLTLGEHAKKLGKQYEYYTLCCDGKLTSRTGVGVVTNNLEVLERANVTMKGEFDYLDTDNSCPTYCGYKIEGRTAYLKYSEELTLTQYAQKYANEYDLFTYCCNGKLDDDRMTLTRDLEEFSLHVSLFNLDSNSVAETEKSMENQFLNNYCDYYCGVRDGVIVSMMKNVDGQTIQDYAASMKASGKIYSGYVKCCDGKMRSRSNVPVYNYNGSVSFNKNFESAYTFEFMDDSKACNYYCAFKDSDKTVTVINTSGSLIDVAKNNIGNYDYVTYCCDNKEKDLGGSLVVVTPYGEETAINSDLYKLITNTPPTKKPVNKTITITTTITTSASTIITNSNNDNTNNNAAPELLKCGSNIGTRCPEGYCCSKYGDCGITPTHCGIGCQPLYGICD